MKLFHVLTSSNTWPLSRECNIFNETCDWKTFSCWSCLRHFLFLSTRETKRDVFVYMRMANTFYINIILFYKSTTTILISFKYTHTHMKISVENVVLTFQMTYLSTSYYDFNFDTFRFNTYLWKNQNLKKKFI